jgi:hypothetical protein
MNPYLERETVWSDFHTEYCKAIKKALVPQVLPEFYVKFNEHIYVHEDAPVRVRLTEVLEERVPFLEIFDKEDNTLVTLIELLSSANKKKGANRDRFLAKRWQIIKSWVDYVKIDLLRGGPRLPMEGMPPCDYYALVSRAAERPDVGLWPVSLRKPLPIVPIPLPAPKKEVRLALQELLQQAYDEAGYANYIYSGPPTPRLRAADARWAKRFVRVS